MTVEDNFVFVNTDGSGKTSNSDRKLIRSRCRIGKNWKIGIRTRRAAGFRVPPYRAAGQHSELGPFQQQALGSHQSPGSATSQDQRSIPEDDLYWKFHKLSVPRSPASDLCVLADSADAGSRLHLIHYLTHASHLIYPVELCLDFDVSQSNGIRWIFEDPTYLHYTLLFSSAINDACLRQPMGKTTYYHLVQAIKYRNQKLARCELDDSTVSVVSSLAISSAILADYDAAKAHFQGLQLVVRLRGGLEAFRHDMALYMKLARVDLAYTLHTGEAPLFVNFDEGFLADQTQPLYITSHQNSHSGIDTDILGDTSVDGASLPSLTPDVEEGICPKLASILDQPDTYPQLPAILKPLRDDDRIAAVFCDLQRLTQILNNYRRLKDSDFKLAVCSIQYRLLSLDHVFPPATLPECLRLAMLVFLTTTFEIPDRGKRYPYLAARFRASACAMLELYEPRAVWEDVRDDFVLWLLVIGGVSLYGVEEEWVRNRWRKLVPEGEMWYTTRMRLKQFLWIDALHDKLGEEMHDALRGDKKPLPKVGMSKWWLSGWGICPLEL
ncbi:hypothetical protein GE09DRAFT_545805 [Coniochaeta sp. 2T2.1]|nr:hypothetical protein GE09DRAFT_545805 [Coniochaeta sp. 2T2.1]